MRHRRSTPGRRAQVIAEPFGPIALAFRSPVDYESLGGAMSKTDLLNYVISSVECLLCAGVICILMARRLFGKYPNLGLFLAVRLAADILMVLLLFEARQRPRAYALKFYHLYFCVYWVSYAIEAALLLLAIYGIYRLAMAPLTGLQRLGKLVFRWVAAISIAISISLAFGPKVNSRDFLVRAVTQIQQTSSVLTLCILLFVCLAIRPMGLSFKSRVFGVSLGLGVLASTNLLAAAWFVTNRNMYSFFSIVDSLAVCASFAIWTVYFIAPEPKRRMIVLPTTSPFLRWNQISLALGDEPGFVAVAGVPPEMFAEAEIEVMTRASRKMASSATEQTFASQIPPAQLASLSMMGTPSRNPQPEHNCSPA